MIDIFVINDKTRQSQEPKLDEDRNKTSCQYQIAVLL